MFDTTHDSLWQIFKKRRREKKRRKAFEKEVADIKAKSMVYRITPCGISAFKVEFKIIISPGEGSTWTQLDVFPTEQMAQDAIHKGIEIWAKKIAADVVECERKFFLSSASYEYPPNSNLRYYHDAHFASALNESRDSFVRTLSPSEASRYYKEIVNAER